MSRTKVEEKDELVKRWLNSCSKEDTRYSYATAFKLYQDYSGLDARALILEAQEDQKKDVLEQQDIVKTRLLGFHKWLTEDAPRTKADGRRPRIEVGKGYLPTTAYNYMTGIRSFYAHFGCVVRLRGRSKIGKPRVTYKRMLFNNVQVRKLVEHARSPRDKAIILTLFQSGMDVKTLCGMIYGDVANGLEANEYPLRLNPYREKASNQYFTFIGRDAIAALRTYLDEMRAKGVVFEHETPLFIKEIYKTDGNGKVMPRALETNNAQDFFKDLALRAGFIKEGDSNGFNIYGPHALRESFGSIATSNKIPKSVVDLWLGHEIGQLAEAYERVQFEDVKQMYLGIEPLLSIDVGGGEKVDVETLRAEIRSEMETTLEKSKDELQTLVNRLTNQNLTSLDKIEKLDVRLRLWEETLEAWANEAVSKPEVFGGIGAELQRMIVGMKTKRQEA